MKTKNNENNLLKKWNESRENRRVRVRSDLKRYGKDVLNSKEMEQAFDQTHHLWSTVGEHTLRVATSSLLICYVLKKFHIRVNIPAIVVGSLCHDLGILGRDEKYSSGKECGIKHPKDSAIVADELVEGLSTKTRDIIERHMWPFGGKVPNSKEGVIVSISDKYNSVKDLIKGSDIKGTGVKRFLKGEGNDDAGGDDSL